MALCLYVIQATLRYFFQLLDTKPHLPHTFSLLDVNGNAASVCIGKMGINEGTSLTREGF